MADRTTIARSPESVSTTRRAVPEKWTTLSRLGWPAGDIHDNYANSHAAGYAYIKGCAREHVTWDDAYRELRRGTLYDQAWGTKTTSKGKRRTLSPPDAEDRCRKDWDKATRQVDDNPLVTDRPGALHTIAVTRETARHHPWKGRSALRDKIVLNAILDAGQRLGTLHPTISTRSLTEETPYRDRKTIRNAIKALTAAGWIRPDRTGCATDQPSAIHIRTPIFDKVGDTAPPHRAYRGEPLLGPQPPPLVPVRPSADSDKRRLAMVTSPAGQAVHAALWERPQGRNQVAKRAGVATKTASQWLTKLALMGLARQRPDGWVLGDTDPGLVAHERGADLVEFERAERHAEQRTDWQDRKMRRAKSDAEVNKRISALVAARRAENVHKCVAVTKRGDPCPTGADEWGLCHVHDPDGVYGLRHRQHAARMLTQPAVAEALERRARAALALGCAPVAAAPRRGPETRAGAVNPERWAEDERRMRERREAGRARGEDAPVER